jgi:hypothetical protein
MIGVCRLGIVFDDGEAQRRNHARISKDADRFPLRPIKVGRTATK